MKKPQPKKRTTSFLSKKKKKVSFAEKFHEVVLDFTKNPFRKK